MKAVLPRISFITALLTLGCTAVFSVVSAAWTPPTAPPPGGNVAAPLNTSGSPQTKEGSLTLGGFLYLDADDLYITPNGARGLFWNNSHDVLKPHVNFWVNVNTSKPTLYLSPGDTGATDVVEIQGDELSAEALSQGRAGICNGTKTVKADSNGKLYCADDLTGGAGSYTAANGLTLNGTTFELGGALSRSTMISQSDNNMIYRLTGAGDFQIQNNAGGDRFVVTDSGKVYLPGIDICEGSGVLATRGGGEIYCDTDDTAGDSLWEGIAGNNVNPKTPAATKVRIGWSGAGDATALSVKNNSVNTAIYGEQANAAGWAGYFAGNVTVDGNKASVVDPTNSGFLINDTKNCNGNNTLDTDANGYIICGIDQGVDYYTVKTGTNDATPNFLFNELTSSDNSITFTVTGAPNTNQTLDLKAAGSGDSLWEGIAGNNINPKTPAATKVRIGWSGAGDATLLSVINDSDKSAIYGEQRNAAGFAGYFSGKTVVMGGNVGINQINPLGRLTVNGAIYLGFNQVVNPQIDNRLIVGAFDGGVGTFGNAEIIWLNNVAHLYGAYVKGGLRLDNDLYVDSGTVRLPIISCTGSGANSVLETNASGQIVCGTDDTGGGGAGDNLGNHTATQNLKMNGFWVSNDGGDEGVYVQPNGNVGIGLNNPSEKLTVGGNATINGNASVAGNIFGTTGNSYLKLGGFVYLQSDEGSVTSLTSNAYYNGSAWAGTDGGSAGRLQINRGTLTYMSAATMPGAWTNRFVITSGGNVSTPNLYKLNGTTKFVDDCAANSSIRTINADGSVVCEPDDTGGGLPSGSTNQTLRYNGTTWVADGTILNNGTQAAIGTSLGSALLTVGNNYTTNHTIAASNSATTNHDAVAGFKNGNNVQGSGVYGELDVQICSGICAAIYGSDGPGGSGEWAGYFDGPVNITGKLTVEGQPINQSCILSTTQNPFPGGNFPSGTIYDLVQTYWTTPAVATGALVCGNAVDTCTAQWAAADPPSGIVACTIVVSGSSGNPCVPGCNTNCHEPGKLTQYTHFYWCRTD